MIRYVYIAIAIILFVVAYGYITTDRRSDDARVTEVVTNVVAGANARNLSQCISNISADFRTASDINKDRLRLLVAQTFRSETSFQMETTLKSLAVDGDTAQAVVNVVIRGWEEGSTTYQRDINVRFKRERTRRLLLVPSNNWKVTFVDSLVVGGEEDVF